MHRSGGKLHRPCEESRCSLRWNGFDGSPTYENSEFYLRIPRIAANVEGTM